jgi:hypothetical protein
MTLKLILVRNINKVHSFSGAGVHQGCQIFLVAAYQNGKNTPK